MEPVNTPTAQPATPRRALKRLALAAALVVGVVVFGDIGVIAYNLLRPVPTPAIILKPAAVTPGAVAAAAPTRPDAPTTAALDRPIVDRPIADRSIPELIPLASLSQPDQIEKARAINAQYANAVRMLRAYLQQREKLDYATAHKMLMVDGHTLDIDRALERDFNDLLQREPYHNGAWFDQMYAAEGVDQDELMLDLFVRHQRWIDASNVSMLHRRSWDDQVYYLRQAGSRGQMILAFRSTGRIYYALKGSLFSIGPNFHWPRMPDR